MGSRIKGDAGRMCFWIFKVKLASPVSPLFQKSTKLRFGKISSGDNLSLVLLFISNLTNGLRLHQFLVTKSREANKSVKTDANGAH